MELGNIYFHTATILHWYKLFEQNKYKDILIESLDYLVKANKIKVYGFVIMPNHVHLIWEMLDLNGKEMPHASFMKYTSHQIQKELQISNSDILSFFKVNTDTRIYQFWQRESLSILLYTPEVVYQKLNYIHNNPCQGMWMLAENPTLYKYSSANFYEKDLNEFGFLTHIGERL